MQRQVYCATVVSYYEATVLLGQQNTALTFIHATLPQIYYARKLPFRHVYIIRSYRAILREDYCATGVPCYRVGYYQEGKVQCYYSYTPAYNQDYYATKLPHGLAFILQSYKATLPQVSHAKSALCYHATMLLCYHPPISQICHATFLL